MLQVLIPRTIRVYRLTQRPLLKQFRRDVQPYQEIPQEYNSLRKCYWTDINFSNLLSANNEENVLHFRVIFCDFYDEHIQTVMKCPYEKVLKCIHRISISSM